MLGGPGLIDGAILRLKERARQEKELPEPLQSEDLPTYTGGSLGSFREGLQMLPNAALKAMGEDKVMICVTTRLVELGGELRGWFAVQRRR